MYDGNYIEVEADFENSVELDITDFKNSVELSVYDVFTTRSFLTQSQIYEEDGEVIHESNT